MNTTRLACNRAVCTRHNESCCCSGRQRNLLDRATSLVEVFIFIYFAGIFTFFFFFRHISDCNYYNMFVLFNMAIILCISDLKKKKNQTKHTIIILLYMIRLYRMKYKFTYVYNMFINDDVSTICMYVCSMRLNMKTSCWFVCLDGITVFVFFFSLFIKTVYAMPHACIYIFLRISFHVL